MKQIFCIIIGLSSKESLKVIFISCWSLSADFMLFKLFEYSVLS